MTGIRDLRAAAEGRGGKLTLSLLAYGYSKSRDANDFLVGSIIGSVGPPSAGRPGDVRARPPARPNSGWRLRTCCPLPCRTILT
jgi:hypothetical protein